MEELWQQTTEMLLRRPLLWLPVLIADLFGFLISLGDQLLIQADIRHNLQFRSALGGTFGVGQGRPGAVEHATLIALLLGWAATLLHLLLYTAALAVVAYLVSRFLAESRRQAASFAPLPATRVGGLVGLAFQAWIMYVVLSFGFGWLTRALVTHGHRAWLSGGWLEFGAGVLFVALLAFLLAPGALQMLTQRRLAHVWNSRAQLFAFLLGTVAVVLTRYVAASLHSVRITQMAVRFGLELTGSWIAALPYAVMFTGLALLAARGLAEAQEQAAAS